MSRAFVLLCLLVLACSGLVPGAAIGAPEKAEWEFSSADPGASAYFFRFRLHDTGCVRIALEMEPLNFSRETVVVADAFGTDPATLAAFLRGEPGPEQPAGRDQWLAWGAAAHFEDKPGSSYFHLNASAADVPIVAVDRVEETPHRSGVKFTGSGMTACALEPRRLDGHFWAFLMTSQPLASSRAHVTFYRSSDLFQEGPGDAPGLVEASTSSRTFAHDQSRFTGTLSYSGDPFDVGSENTVALNLETAFDASAGFAGGAITFPRKGTSHATLSYQGPPGHAGAASTLVAPATTLLLHHVDGPAGRWTFRAHEYTHLESASRLVAWGADIALPAPPT